MKQKHFKLLTLEDKNRFGTQFITNRRNLPIYIFFMDEERPIYVPGHSVLQWSGEYEVNIISKVPEYKEFMMPINHVEFMNRKTK